ncbi:MAG: hypothetical protein ABI054_02710 [Planctomycetota bacterium]
METVPGRARLSIAVEAALLVAVAVFSLVFAGLHQSRNKVHPPAALERLCAYTAETPYQTRILVPTLVRAVDVSGIGARIGFSREDSARWIEIACTIGFFYALRALLAQFLAGAWASTLWALLGLYALPFLYVIPRAWPFWYPWDVPAVLVTTLGLLWIRRGQWSWYYWVFPFATLNRETSLFLILIFGLTQLGKLSLWSLAQHIAVQAAIWLCIRWLLAMTFKHHPGVGDFYADALKDNLAALRHATTWMTLSLVFGFLWLPLAIFLRWVREDFVRRALIVVPVFFAAALGLAQFDELRIYGEMLPLVVLGLACGVSGWRASRVTAPSAR